MTKIFHLILLCLIISINLFSQIDFSSYPEIASDDLESYEYTIIYQNEESNINWLQLMV